MWFKRKTKEEKILNLESRLEELNIRYADQINSYCKINNFIFILIGFDIQDNRIVVKFISSDTVKGCVTIADLAIFEMRYGMSDFRLARVQFLSFKENLAKIGLKLEIS